MVAFQNKGWAPGINMLRVQGAMRFGVGIGIRQAQIFRLLEGQSTKPVLS